jgi:radical SAM-linked protein
VIRVVDTLFRLRITFAKKGSLCWLSHLELTRAMERLVRRAGLPYAVSQGFNVHMRYAPGPALPVGTGGMQELFDLWLNEYVDVRHALESLRGVTPEDFSIIAVGYVSPSAKGLQATHIYEGYRVVLRASGADAETLRDRVAQVVAKGELTVSRKGKDKTYDLSSAVVGPVCVEPAPEGADSYAFGFSLRGSESGSLRPEYLLNAALAREPFELLSVTRTSLSDEPPCLCM